MRIYLDVCCLNRPFDDQSQDRIRLEGEAVKCVFDLIACGKHQWIGSEVVEYEIRRHPNEQRRESLGVFLQSANERLVVTPEAVALAKRIAGNGIGDIDAMHMALAELGGCDIMLTTDDRLLRRAKRLSPALRIRVVNPLRWVGEELVQ